MCVEIIVLKKSNGIRHFYKELTSVGELKTFLNEEVNSTATIVFDSIYDASIKTDEHCLCSVAIEKTLFKNNLNFAKEETGEYKVYL